MPHVDYEDPQDRALAQDIFGSDNQVDIVGFLRRYCESERGASLASLGFSHFSIGAVFDIQLSDNRNEVIKIWPPHANSERLQAQVEVQDRVARSGFPAPEVLAPPQVFEKRAVMAMRPLAGETFSALEAGLEQAMAGLLARLIHLTSAETWPSGLTEAISDPPTETLWPKPHNTLFDFDSTAQGAEWIDAIAQEARDVMEQDRATRFIAHMDWSSQNMLRYRDKISAVFDWDSVKSVSEPQAVGNASIHFAANWDHQGRKFPTARESGIFVRCYENARGSEFSNSELGAIAAHATYGLAYSARCAHALGQTAESDSDNALTRLRECGFLTPKAMGLT